MGHRARTTSHWGAFDAELVGGELTVVPHPADPSPSPLLGNIAGAVRHPTRVATPAARRGWLENGPGPDPRRFADDGAQCPARVAHQSRVLGQHSDESRCAPGLPVVAHASTIERELLLSRTDARDVPF